MLELTGWGDILGGVVILYWLLAIYLFRQSVRKSSTRFGKIVSGVVVALLFGFFPLKSCVDEALYVRDHKARLAKAEAIFNERCKTAGERIYRTVDGVEGIMLVKLRPYYFTRKMGYDPYDQGTLDPYGNVGEYGHDDEYILSFFLGRNDSGRLDKESREKTGYRYADVRDPVDGQHYRYTAHWWRNSKWDQETAPLLRLGRTPTSDPIPHYGVTFEDLTTQEERALWIAGGALKIVDLNTNEVLAERIGYMLDRGQGASIATRQPWTHAREWSCPRPAPARDFVEKILKIKE